jgi:hypothetical protein
MKFKYVGNGYFYDGIPARDLSEEDFASLDDKNKAIVASSKLYRSVDQPLKPAEQTASPDNSRGEKNGR